MSPSQPGDMCLLNSARTLEGRRRQGDYRQSPMGPSIPQLGQCKPSWHFTSAHIIGKAHERLLCPSLQLCNHTCQRGLGSTGTHSPHLQCLSGQSFQSRVTAPSYPTLHSISRLHLHDLVKGPACCLGVAAAVAWLRMPAMTFANRESLNKPLNVSYVNLLSLSLGKVTVSTLLRSCGN